MRANPTPASGPVSIKHVRNTVPKKPVPTISTVCSSGGYVHLTSTAVSQLEEPTL